MDSTAGIAPRQSDITNEFLSRVTDEFASPNSPYGLRNHQQTTVTGDMDSTAQTAPRDLEIINELLSRLTGRFDSSNSQYGLRNHQRTAVTGDAWIRQPKQHLRTKKSSTNCCHW